MTITYRLTKGVSLTYEEMDENFRDLHEDTTIDRVLGNGNTTNKSLTVGDLTVGDLSVGDLSVTGNVSSDSVIGTGKAIAMAIVFG